MRMLHVGLYVAGIALAFVRDAEPNPWLSRLTRAVRPFSASS
jgi:hypothetical protein